MLISGRRKLMIHSRRASPTCPSLWFGEHSIQEKLQEATLLGALVRMHIRRGGQMTLPILVRYIQSASDDRRTQRARELHHHEVRFRCITRYMLRNNRTVMRETRCKKGQFQRDMMLTSIPKIYHSTAFCSVTFAIVKRPVFPIELRG